MIPTATSVRARFRVKASYFVSSEQFCEQYEIEAPAPVLARVMVTNAILNLFKGAHSISTEVIAS